MKKILIIEDDPVARTVYQRFFQAQGFMTEVAPDGIKGLEQLTAFEPDAIVLDLMMPKLGGIEVLKNLRAQEAYRELPVLVLTNACVPAFVDQAIQAGATHVFDKSRDEPSAVVGLLEGLLRAGSKNSSPATD